MGAEESIRDETVVLKWLAATLVGGVVPDHGLPDDVFAKILWQIGRRHGVLPLLCHCLHQRKVLPDLGQQIKERLKAHERQAVVEEVLLQEEIRSIVQRLSEKTIDFLLLKGTPLAYCLYDDSSLRPRCDTDFLFPDFATARQAWNIVQQMGYTRPNAISGQCVTHEFSCYRRAAHGASFCLDFHWQLSNNICFARTFSFARLLQQSIRVAALDNVHTLCPVHSFLFACMHRLSHVAEGTADKLIWLYDIYLLSNTFSLQDWQELFQLAKQKQLCGAVQHGIEAARRFFPVSVPDDIWASVVLSAPGEKQSVTIWKSRVRTDLAKLMALESSTDRLRYICQSMFPNPSYMYEKYKISARRGCWLLCFLYVRRICTGMLKLFR